MLDQRWQDAGAAVAMHRSPEDLVVGPVELGPLIGTVVPYRLAAAGLPDWLIVHKGRLAELDGGLLESALRLLQPVHANDVFVVLSARTDLPAVGRHDRHLRTLLQATRSGSARPPNPTQPLDLAEIAWLPRTTLELCSRAACQYAYLGGETALCRILSRYLMYVDTSDESLTPHLALNGIWETWVTQLVARVVRAGDRCVDVGANHGYFSVLLADLIGPAGRLVAVEPNPRLHKLTMASLQANGFSTRAKGIAAAVSDVSGGRARLRVPAGHLADASIVSAGAASAEAVEVETVRLDDLLAGWDRVDVVKIDVEGAEAAVWRGMAEVVRHNPQLKIVVELSVDRAAEPRTLVEDIAAAGFLLRSIQADATLRLLTIDECLNERPWWMLYLSRED